MRIEIAVSLEKPALQQRGPDPCLAVAPRDPRSPRRMDSAVGAGGSHRFAAALPVPAIGTHHEDRKPAVPRTRLEMHTHRPIRKQRHLPLQRGVDPRALVEFDDRDRRLSQHTTRTGTFHHPPGHDRTRTRRRHPFQDIRRTRGTPRRQRRIQLVTFRASPDHQDLFRGPRAAMRPVLKLGCRHRILRNVADRTHSSLVTDGHHRDGRTTPAYTYFSAVGLPSDTASPRLTGPSATPDAPSTNAASHAPRRQNLKDPHGFSPMHLPLPLRGSVPPSASRRSRIAAILTASSPATHQSLRSGPRTRSPRLEKQGAR